MRLKKMHQRRKRIERSQRALFHIFPGKNAREIRRICRKVFGRCHARQRKFTYKMEVPF